MMPMLRMALQTLIVSSMVVFARCGGAALDPYPFLNNGSFDGRAIGLSPDPLVGFVWDLEKLGQQRFAYQSYYDSPVNATGFPAHSFAGVYTYMRATFTGIYIYIYICVTFTGVYTCA